MKHSTPFIGLIFLLLYSCANNTNDIRNTNTYAIDKKAVDTLPIEEKLLDTISKLQEVKDRIIYVNQQSKGKRPLQFIISLLRKDQHEKINIIG